MNISGCSFNELSYSTLFKTYLTNFKKLSSFYEFDPLNDQEFKRRANSLNPSTVNKEQFISALSQYHKKLGIEEQQKVPLEKYARDNALTVVTGQQLGVYGGPVFTIYKTITAILLARKYEEQLQRPVVPVFWLADEDHDFDEIAWTGITGRTDFSNIKLEQEGSGIPVSDEKVTEQINSFKEKVKEELFETDFSESLWEILDTHYKEGNTHVQAFSGLINEWFAGQGVLIVGSNFPGIKKLVSETLQTSISESDSISNAIEEKSVELEQEFHRQVTNGDSNLFYLSDSAERVKINRNKEGWIAGDTKWTNDELLNEISTHPERFSPNVFLRPIIQDKLLPTLGYIAGPGEIAYYGQMRSFYGEFDLVMPPIIPRFTATIIESGISRIIEKLPFEVSEYEKRIEDLESEFVEKTDTVDIEEVFSSWKELMEGAAKEPLKIINEIDPTLDGTVGKTVAGFTNELDRLKGRVYRSIKQQEETQINRIEKIKVNLFPDGGLQERSVSPIYFMNKYGLDIWDKLIHNIEEEGLDLTKHHLIEL